jgi:hypothetical protein
MLWFTSLIPLLCDSKMYELVRTEQGGFTVALSALPLDLRPLQISCPCHLAEQSE